MKGKCEVIKAWSHCLKWNSHCILGSYRFLSETYKRAGDPWVRLCWWSMREEVNCSPFLGPLGTSERPEHARKWWRKAKDTQAAPLISTYIHSMCVYFYTTRIVCVHVCIYTFTFVYLVYIYIYTCTHTYIYVCTHTIVLNFRHSAGFLRTVYKQIIIFSKKCHTYRRQYMVKYLHY